MGFDLVKKYAQHSVKRPLRHRINVSLAIFAFGISCYGLLAYEDLSFLIGILITTVAIGLFASASSFKKKYSI
ncbi:hypothetical protein NB585_20880 [Vibrio parahaemolyticus]|nr:hypothetical protein [Vibrio parahaemolyticus]